MPPVHIFRIGHVNIDHPFQESNHLYGLISRAVIDERKPKTPLYGFGKRGYNLRSVVGRSDEIDIVAAYFLEPDHDPCHVRGRHGFTVAKMADIVILAENTPKVAVGEEDGP
jgi:hypothetical protein